MARLTTTRGEVRQRLLPFKSARWYWCDQPTRTEGRARALFGYASMVLVGLLRPVLALRVNGEHVAYLFVTTNRRRRTIRGFGARPGHGFGHELRNAWLATLPKGTEVVGTARDQAQLTKVYSKVGATWTLGSRHFTIRT